MAGGCKKGKPYNFIKLGQVTYLYQPNEGSVAVAKEA